MTTTPAFPDIPLPPGTVCLDGWQEDVDGLPNYRIISGPDRRIRAISGIVGTSGIQCPDGTIDQTESPQIWAEYGAASMTSAQAREFAAAITNAADEVDGWATR